MRHRVPAVLAVVLVLAAAAPVGPATALPDDGNASTPAASTPVTTVANTTSYLALGGDGVQRQQYGRADLDVAGAVAMDGGELHDRYLGRTTFEAFERAPNASVRTTVLRRTATELENRSRALQREQRRAIQEYNAGSLTAGALLRRLAVVDARSSRLNDFVNRLLRDVSRDPDYSLPNTLRTRLQNIQAEPTFLQGSLRTRAGDAITGQRSGIDVYVRTSSQGVVLARVSGDRYVREAYDGSAYRDGATDQFKQSPQDPIIAASERARELYPWAFDNDISYPRARGFGLTSVYRITLDHSQGQLTSYIDGATTRAFREIQNKRLSRLPNAGARTADSEMLDLRVNVTHDTGPMEVRVTRTDTGEPVDAAVKVGGTVVDRTGEDGRVWLVQPAGPTKVNATTAEGASVAVTVGQ